MGKSLHGIYVRGGRTERVRPCHSKAHSLIMVTSCHTNSDQATIIIWQYEEMSQSAFYKFIDTNACNVGWIFQHYITPYIQQAYYSIQTNLEFRMYLCEINEARNFYALNFHIIHVNQKF